MVISPRLRRLLGLGNPHPRHVAEAAGLMGDHHHHHHLGLRTGRRGAALRKWQAKIYNFLERPTGRGALAYHILVFCLVCLCLGLSIFSTIAEYEAEAGELLYQLEIVIVLWFSLELIVRSWSAGCRSRYQGY